MLNNRAISDLTKIVTLINSLPSSAQDLVTMLVMVPHTWGVSVQFWRSPAAYGRKVFGGESNFRQGGS